MLGAFTAAIFLSAALLFLVQPMVARLLLPQLGGSPAVWNTCMLFFQAALLAGYLYAHLLGRVRRRAVQGAVHLAVMALAAAALPLGRLTAGAPPSEGSPVAWLLWTLALAVGAPFLVLSTTGPLVQRWFAMTDHPAAKDPYFLYAASNAGSMLALVGYPLLVEPALALGAQRLAWSWGYGLFVIAAAVCAVLLLRHGRDAPAGGHDAAVAPSPGARVRLMWVLLAFVPSSLMLGVTQYLSTDIAAVPLLWVAPLAVYLLTFIVAFSPRPLVPMESAAKLVPFICAAIALIYLFELRRPVWIVLVLHIVGLFFMSLTCHGRLAAMRPHPSRLTEFYLLIAVGGVLGGVFNALLAPVIFHDVLEYPVAIVLACLVRPRPKDSRMPLARVRHGWAVDLLIPVCAAVFVLGVSELTRSAQIVGGWLVPVVGYVVPIAALCLLAARTTGFALGLGVMLSLALLFSGTRGRLLHAERTFFGVYRVARTYDLLENKRPANVLFHGTTIHGFQAADGVAGVPGSYYSPQGPIGDVFAVMGGRQARVGLVGLGVGSLASFARPGDHFTFHEIDPAVVRLARDERYFTFVREATERGDDRLPVTVDFALGDGRQTLARSEPGTYRLIVLDAFSSDSIPIHLITRDAVRMYVERLRPDGLLAFHISNRYLNLRPVLGAIAGDLGLVAYINDDGFPDELVGTIRVLDETLIRLREERGPGAAETVQAERAIKDAAEELQRGQGQGRTASTWVVMARRPADVGALTERKVWDPLPPTEGAPLWTDDYSNIFGVLQWH